MILEPFPAPPGTVADALSVLEVVRNGKQAALEVLGDVADLARPWEPATCPDPLREALWDWCDRVAAWINATYAWRPASMIPACWPAHPHLAAELAALAVQRHLARLALDPAPLEDWHRYTLPMFIDRLSARLGPSTCRDGTHTDGPAGPRRDHYARSRRHRAERFHADTHPSPPGERRSRP